MLPSAIQTAFIGWKERVNNKGKQFSSRFWEPYDELVIQKARAARIKPNQLVRVATMAFVDPDLLSIHERVSAIDESLKELRSEQAKLLDSVKRVIGI